MSFTRRRGSIAALVAVGFLASCGGGGNSGSGGAGGSGGSGGSAGSGGATVFEPQCSSDGWCWSNPTPHGHNLNTVWGTGAATRDFLYVEDAAEAVLLACERYDDAEPLNLGSGQETRIAELAALVAACAGFQGEIRWDASRPDGTPRRCVDVARAREHLGFEPRTPLRTGIQRTVDWYRAHR